MAIKISGSTIINDSRILENADKIGIGTANPRYDLDIFASSAPTGIAVSATSTQTTDVNKALSVFNNSNTNNFSVSYKGRVDAVEYYGTFKGSIDPSVPIENATKIQIHHNSTNSFFNVPFFASGLADDSYQDVQYDNSDSLQFNPSTGRLRINSSDGFDALTIRTNANSLNRGLAFQNSGDAYVGYVGMVDAGNNTADLVFGVDDATNADVHLVEERMRIATDGNVGIGTNNPLNKFEVYGTDATVTLLNYGQSSGGLAAWTSGRLAFVSAHQNDDLVFGYSNSTLSVGNFVERMRIDNGTGNVGIGTDNPTARLHVYRATTFAGNPIIQARSNHGSTNQLKFEIDGDGDAYFNGNVGIGTITPQAILHIEDGSPGIRLSDSGNAGAYAYFDANAANAIIHADKDNELNDSRVAFAVDNDEKVRIDSDGNVRAKTGIQYKGFTLVKADGGTVAQLVGLSGSNDTGALALWSGGLKYAQLSAVGNSFLTGGNLGVGTNSPNNPLTVHGSGNHIFLKDTATDNVFQMRHQGGTAQFNTYGTGGARRDFVFSQYATEVLRIDSSGNLLRGGTGQNIGASNARWDTGYFTTIDASNLTGTISAPGSNTQVLFNNNGDVGADAGLTFDASTDKLTVGGDIKLGGTGNGGTLFFDETGGGVEKIKQSGGSLELYADGAIKFIESDNDTLMVTFDINTTYNDARIILENDTDTYFNHPANNQLGLTAGGFEIIRIASDTVGIGSTVPNMKVGISTSTLQGKLDIDTGTGQNSDTEYYGQDFGLVIKHQSGSGANEEGNGICFVQKWYSGSGDLVRTGAILGYKQSSNGSFGGGLIFKTQQNGASPLAEVLRLTQEGNIGIGIDNPGYRLEIGDVLTNNNIKIGSRITGQNYGIAFGYYDNLSGNHGFGIDRKHGGTLTTNAFVMRADTGNVGIGTDNPQEKLHISDIGNPKLLIEDTDSDNQVAVRYKTTSRDWIAGLHGGVNSFKISKSTAFGTNDYFTINGSGYVGINKDTPTNQLDVVGNANIAGDLTVTGTLNATVTGTAENATNINVAADNTTNATHYPIFVGGATGNQRPNSDTGLTYNPSSGNLSARNFFAILDGGTNTNSQQIVAGDSSGSVALTINDGYGNANVAFNHRNGVPDSNGSSGRIWCAVDSTTAQMNFELADSAVSSQAKSMTDVLQLLTNQIKPLKNIIPSTDGTIDLGTNATRFGHGYFDNVTAANISGTISVTGSNKQVLFNSAGNVGAATTLTIEPSGINVGGSINLTSELNFTGSNNKYIDVETLASSNSFNIRHHNPTGNLFENAFVSTANAETKLYFDGSKIFETTQRGIKLTSNLASNGGMANMLELNNTGNNSGDGSTISFSRAGTIRAELQVIKNETSNNETDMVFKTTKSGGTVVENMRILGSSERVLIGDGLTTDNTATLGKLVVGAGSNNLGGIQIHAGGGETAGDLSGICFSHGNTGTAARPKAAIALRAAGSYGRGDLCFYVDNASDNNAVSSADEVMRINRVNGTVNIGGDYTQTTDRLQVTGSTKINGDLTVTGTLAYEDVTNVVSAGIVTAVAFRALGGTFRNTTGSESHPTNVAMMIEKDDFIYTNDGTSSKRRLIGKTSGTEVIEIGQTGTALIDEIRMEPGNAGFFSVVTGGATGLPASGERIRVSAGGSFAVATNDPKEQIHLKDGAILVENVDYAANQDAPYLIAGSQNHASGGNTNTNWGTSGMQHRIKSNSGGVPRLTIDVRGIEYFSFVNGGSLGIDAPDPTAKLQIGGNTGDALRVGETEFKVHQSASSWSSLTYASNPILAWDFKTGTGDMMYMASGGNTATANQMALVISDGHGFKIGRSGYDGTDYDVDSSNEYLRLTTSGTLNIGGDYTQTTKKLKVTGDAEVTGTLTAGSLAFDGTSTGNFTIDGELIISDYIRHKDDTNTHIRFPADDTIRFTTSNAEAVEITPDRSIRIGEASPIVLDASNEEAIYIKADIRSADADTVYGIRMDIDDDNTGTTTADRERGSMYLHFDGNNAGGDGNNETRLYNVWSDVNVAQDYDLVRGIYSDVAISNSTGDNASMNGVYTDIRITNAANANLVAGHFAYARKSGANATGSITQMYGQYAIARNDGGATGSVTSMYGTRSEVRLSDGNTGTNANTNVSVSNVYAVYARMENDNHANGQSNTGMTALYYGTYATTSGLNNPYGLYINSSAPNNYIGGNLEVNGNLTVNGTISDGAVTDVAVSYTGRSAPCTLPITITGTATKTINIPTNSNAFGAKYVQTSEPTGTSICDGDVWYDTSTGSGSGGITISNATEATYRNITFADSSSSTTLKVNDNGRLQVRPSDGAVRVAGDITAFYSSDQRLKKNISPIKNALEKVNSISGNTFEWNEKTHNEGKEVGVIAQEVEKLELPGVTTTRQDGTKAVRYEKLVPLLIEAIKELKCEIDEIKRSK